MSNKSIDEKNRRNQLPYASTKFWEATCSHRGILGNSWGTRWKAYTKIRYKKYQAMTGRYWSDGRKHILDIGCCDGDFCKLLFLKNPKNRICGIDCSKSAIDAARARFPQMEFKKVGEELTDESLKENDFDLVFCTGTIHYLSSGNFNNVFRIISQTLKEDGRFLLEIPATVETKKKVMMMEALRRYFALEKREYEYGMKYITTFRSFWNESFQLAHPDKLKWLLTLILLGNYPLAWLFEKSAERRGLKKDVSGEILLCKKRFDASRYSG